MRVRVELDWFLEIPDDAVDYEAEVEKIMAGLLPVPFGEFADQMTVVSVEQPEPWESS